MELEFQEKIVVLSKRLLLPFEGRVPLCRFRKALLREGIDNLLSGEVETGKIILRDFINATVGFNKLSDVTHRSKPLISTSSKTGRNCGCPCWPAQQQNQAARYEHAHSCDMPGLRIKELPYAPQKIPETIGLRHNYVNTDCRCQSIA